MDRPLPLHENPIGGGDIFLGPFPPDPCPYCGASLSWLRDGETVKGAGDDRAHSGCYDTGERR